MLKLEGEHIQFVFDCLRENTTQIRNMKQYLLAVRKKQAEAAQAI